MEAEWKKLGKIPESIYDDLPLSTSRECPLKIVRVNFEDLVSHPERFAEAITTSLAKQGFFVISMPEKHQDKIDALYDSMKDFFALPLEQKQKFTDLKGFHQHGYSHIHFDNAKTHRVRRERERVCHPFFLDFGVGVLTLKKKKKKSQK